MIINNPKYFNLDLTSVLHNLILPVVNYKYVKLR